MGWVLFCFHEVWIRLFLEELQENSHLFHSSQPNSSHKGCYYQSSQPVSVALFMASKKQSKTGTALWLRRGIRIALRCLCCLHASVCRFTSGRPARLEPGKPPQKWRSESVSGKGGYFFSECFAGVNRKAGLLWALKADIRLAEVVNQHNQWNPGFGADWKLLHIDMEPSREVFLIPSVNFHCFVFIFKSAVLQGIPTSCFLNKISITENK